jgi:hypothetical protein
MSTGRVSGRNPRGRRPRSPHRPRPARQVRHWRPSGRLPIRRRCHPCLRTCHNMGPRRLPPSLHPAVPFPLLPNRYRARVQARRNRARYSQDRASRSPRLLKLCVRGRGLPNRRNVRISCRGSARRSLAKAREALPAAPRPFRSPRPRPMRRLNRRDGPWRVSPQRVQWCRRVPISLSNSAPPDPPCRRNPLRLGREYRNRSPARRFQGSRFIADRSGLASPW